MAEREKYVPPTTTNTSPTPTATNTANNNTSDDTNRTRNSVTFLLSESSSIGSASASTADGQASSSSSVPAEVRAEAQRLFFKAPKTELHYQGRGPYNTPDQRVHYQCRDCAKDVGLTFNDPTRCYRCGSRVLLKYRRKYLGTFQYEAR
ncbi:hypothetical protein B0T17DRAFT_507807 [Bombardia bombarda]|uniref:Uncharacterized protein n=1 Tax=Bombardia bombarda TaxID=252184 RepID=A0AA39X0J2_9PEZI|nr:hypothetical protein B0T17DRAFT_507807 [Bombardia bombarda]